jgi:hypothetical protein
MITKEKPVVGIYVDRTCPAHWVVKDCHGRFWMVPPGENAWQRREPYEPTEETELVPVPSHYEYMLGLHEER